VWMISEEWTQKCIQLSTVLSREQAKERRREGTRRQLIYKRLIR
jgi:hypothetical protein